MNIERARLRLREDRDGVTRLDRATLENLAERVDPFCFDAIRKHALSPIRQLDQTSGNPRSRYVLKACKTPFRIKPSSEIVISGTNMSTA